MEKVVSWNKRVRGGDICQLEQKGKGWLSAGTKSATTFPGTTWCLNKCNHGLVARSKGGHTVDLVTTWDGGDN